VVTRIASRKRVFFSLADPKKFEKSIGKVLAEPALKHLITNQHTIPNPGFLRDYEIAASVL